MNTITRNSSVGEIIRNHPWLSVVFERHRIDYCCGGHLSLEQACSSANQDIDKILEELQLQKVEVRKGGVRDADTMTLTELADHIVETHHDYLKRELPRLEEIVNKVARVHSDKDARLNQVRDAFNSLMQEMLHHMMKEERVLFPMIRILETAQSLPSFHCASVSNPIRQMEDEHAAAGDALSLIAKATDNYSLPPWACNTYRVMIDSLRNLELDMHQHVHKENNILFPKAMAKEADLLAKH